MQRMARDNLETTLAGWRHAGLTRIAGVDEVGRGPLAGPVVAAAVILPAGFDAAGITDSKALSAKQREVHAEQILVAAQVGIAYLPAPAIDRLNIHHATLLTMRRALAALPVPAEAALIDGKFTPSGIACPAQAVIKGDSRVLAIAAASIVAKVARDRLMASAERDFPGYGFARHAGYPTKMHRDALARQGLCPLHRRSFGPCKALET